jgi:hypothetical protein
MRRRVLAQGRREAIHLLHCKSMGGGKGSDGEHIRAVVAEWVGLAPRLYVNVWVHFANHSTRVKTRRRQEREGAEGVRER